MVRSPRHCSRQTRSDDVEAKLQSAGCAKATNRALCVYYTPCKRMQVSNTRAVRMLTGRYGVFALPPAAPLEEQDGVHVSIMADPSAPWVCSVKIAVSVMQWGEGGALVCCIADPSET